MKTQENQLYGQGIAVLPVEIPTASFLTGEEGREIVAAVTRDYSKHPIIRNEFNYDEELGCATGSNAFILGAVQKYLPAGSRLATLAEVQDIASRHPQALRGTYVDTGMFIATTQDQQNASNNTLAEKLAKEFRKRDVEGLMKMINMPGLDMEVDGNSDYGLSFHLREDAEIIPAEILAQSGRFVIKDIERKTGIPKKLDPEGERGLYGRNTGISGVYLNGDLDLGSYWGRLGDSDPGGRVVVVKGAAGAKKILEQHLAELERENVQILVKQNERFKRAKDILYGRQ